MKWLLFFIVVFLTCCTYQQKEKIKQQFVDSIKSISPEILLNQKGEIYTDSFAAEYILLSDTGYFKNLGIKKINALTYPLNNLLDSFLDKLVVKKEIILLIKEGLSHSCRVIDNGNRRFDTLQNGKVSFIQKEILGLYSEDNNGRSVLRIDGKVVKAKSITDTESEYLFDFDASSFRHFSFYDKEFYYIRANQTGSMGASMGNVSYHLIYDLSLNKLFYLETCRLENVILFGDVNGDKSIDFINFDNSEFCTTVPGSDRVVIQLYSYKNGKFILQKDKKGVPYSIEGNTGFHYAQDSFNIKKSYWPVKLN